MSERQTTSSPPAALSLAMRQSRERGSDSGRTAGQPLQKREGPERDDLVWVVGLWLLLGAVHSPVLAGVVTYFHNDLWSWFLPVHEYLRQELWQGHLLPWSPLVSCGYPLSAEPQTGIFYPLNLLFALPLPITVVMGLSLWVHYGLAASGTYALARRFGCTARGSFVAAAIFALSGFMVAHLHHFAIVCAAAWFPWAWYAAYSYRLRPRRRLLVLLWVCSAAQLLAGQPQVWVLTFASALVWLLLGELLLPQMKQTRPVGASLLARWGLPVAAIALGVGLAGVTILPMLELFGHSVRSKPTLDFVTSYPLNRATLASFVRLKIDLGDNWEYEGFAGLTTLLLAVVAFVISKERPRLQLLLAMLLFAFFMGMATQNPLYRVIVHLPLVSGFRCAARWLLIISACLGLLAGWGLTELEGRRRWASSLLTGLVVVEVAWFALNYNPVLPTWAWHPPAVQSGMWGAGRYVSSLPYRLPDQGSERGQYEVGRNLLVPNLNLMWREASVEGYMPLQLKAFSALRQELDPAREPDRAAGLGAHWLLANADEPRPAAGWEGVTEAEGVRLYRNRHYRGWCWLERPDPAADGIAYSHYGGQGAYANVSVSRPNRLIFALIRGPWLTATDGTRPVALEDNGEGLCAVNVGPGCGLTSLHYHHPRLREGIVVSLIALALFAMMMISITFFRQRRPRQTGAFLPGD